ncbi:WD40/YVTN/BNR-like repeat-containing protein [Salinimonas chungwhensis]|uniref:WD40/YVTN/BNR-like repeat-containing protein n=1 Tax=Salinimonas chungwhensis TaxID=265425 RepID=UPI00036745F5|nr:hypothetical protein [Salinimonas chungwhensis]
MKKPLAAFAALAISTAVFAQDAYQAPLVEQSLLLDITAGEQVVIVGERGHILLSSDGETFAQANVPTTATLTAVTLIDNHIWAAGHDATIIHSADGGQTWNLQFEAPDKQRPFLDITFFNKQHGVAVGAYGMFYRTQDGGKKWQSEQHVSLLDPYDREYLEEVRAEDEAFYQQELNSILPHINRVTLVDDRLYLAGEAGTLAYSNDMGHTWQRFEVDYTGSFFDIKPLDASTLLAVGLRGNIFVMRDDQQWEYVKTCSTSTLNSIYLENDDTVYALGNNGMVVSLSRPLPVSQHDPYANPANCEPAEGVSARQVANKAAIVNAEGFQGKVIAVTANGIESLNLQ